MQRHFPLNLRQGTNLRIGTTVASLVIISSCKTRDMNSSVLKDVSTQKVITFQVKNFTPLYKMRRLGCVDEIMQADDGRGQNSRSFYVTTLGSASQGKCATQIAKINGVSYVRISALNRIRTLQFQDGLVGGADAELGQFPATAGLLIDSQDGENPDYLTCTMTKVAPKMYLTAAHCLFLGEGVPRELRPFMLPGKKIGILTGVVNDGVTKTKAEKATVAKLHIHPTWADVNAPTEIDTVTREAADFDVAVIEVREEVARDLKIAKVSSQALRAGDKVIMQGFGCRSFHSSGTENLAFKEEQITSLKGTNSFIRLERNENGKVAGVCPGDSGGALYLSGDRNMLTVVGVNSRYMNDSILGAPPRQTENFFTRLDKEAQGSIYEWYSAILKN